MGRSCSNDCDIKCEVPKYEKCISKCNKPNVEWYDEKSYDLWYTKGRGSRGYAYYWDYDVVLINNDWYEEWIDENFSWYQEELKEYESCKSTCWKAPSYGLFN